MVNAIGFDKADARAPLEAVRYLKAETRYLRRFDDFIKFELMLISLSKEPEPEWNIARYLNAMTQTVSRQSSDFNVKFYTHNWPVNLVPNENAKKPFC